MYQPPPYEGPFSVQQASFSDFKGVGPRFGILADYRATNGFGFLGETAGSALIGQLSARTNFLISSQQLLEVYNQASNSQFINDENVYTVIPGFDAKLGLTYQHEFRHALFKVSAGYQTAIYLNAISQYLPQTLVLNEPIQSGGVFIETMRHNISNYSVQGPFLNVSVHA